MLMTYNDFYDRLMDKYYQAIEMTKTHDFEFCEIKKFAVGGRPVVMEHDYGQGYDAVFCLGKIQVSYEDAGELDFPFVELYLPYFWGDKDEEIEYLDSHCLSVSDLVDGVVLKSFTEWEQLIFNAPFTFGDTENIFARVKTAEEFSNAVYGFLVGSIAIAEQQAIEHLEKEQKQ
jgi:hypothetical protein